jgi:hypothetical protein
MKYRSGWFRVWIVVSALWIAPTSVYVIAEKVSEHREIENTKNENQLKRQADRAMGRPYIAFSLEDDRSSIEILLHKSWHAIWPLILIFGPPIVIPALVYATNGAGGWIREGFDTPAD